MLSRRLLRIKVVKALYAHVQCEGDNLIAAQKSLLNSVDATYNLYLLLLQLPVEIARNIREMQELAKAKHLATYEDRNPNTRFVDCKVVQLIENNDELNDYASAKGLNWSQHTDAIKSLTADFVASEVYKKYLLYPNNQSVDDDTALLTKLFVEQLQQSEMIEELIETISISMSSDLTYALPLVMRTLGSIRNSSTDIKIMRKYKNEDDQAFVKSLFERAIINYKEYNDYIEKFTTNWDAERIVMMDFIIMTVAMSELINFADIPVKVTLDEYIDIARYYSTNSSPTFVNGLLDMVSKSLDKEERLKKSGRGLM